MDAEFRLMPHYDENGYDAVLFNVEDGMFGVFDGMGTSEDSRQAAIKVRDSFVNWKGSFEHMASNINSQAFQIDRGGTTATVVKCSQWGLEYAHIGDSRLYVLSNNRIKQITADEGFENILYNYVGSGTRGVCQAGYIPSSNWDKFIICSDGVTGDYGSQLISDIQLENILNSTDNPKEAISKIIEISTKPDDKSLIVVFKSVDK